MENRISSKIKAKKLGVLLRDAREATSRSLEECAQAVGTTVDAMKHYELGEKSPSLPELEILAHYLKVPLEHFWGEELLESKEGDVEFDPQKLIALRQKIIGVLIRKYRSEKALSQEELAAALDIPLSQLQAYELGLQPIPVTELDSLARELGWQIKVFQDNQGPVGSWLAKQRYFKDFMSLSPEMQEFICKPINQSYLEVAQRLSEMSVDRLRTIAEVLLDITL
jgi:transcriptional regulator with XRE-family HTH domain